MRMTAFIARMLGHPDKAPEPVYREPTFAVTEVGGRWHLALFIEYTNLWAEDFQGPKWAWYQWNRGSFDTKEAAEKCGRQQIARFQAEQSEKLAREVFKGTLPRTT